MFAFIIGDFLNSGSTYFRQSQERIAEIDGEVVKIQDYQGRVDEMAEMYKMQSGSASLPEEYMTQIRHPYSMRWYKRSCWTRLLLN